MPVSSKWAGVWCTGTGEINPHCQPLPTIVVQEKSPKLEANCHVILEILKLRWVPFRLTLLPSYCARLLNIYFTQINFLYTLMAFEVKKMFHASSPVKCKFSGKVCVICGKELTNNSCKTISSGRGKDSFN